MNKRRQSFFKLKRIKEDKEDFFTPEENVVFINLDCFLSCQNFYEIHENIVCNFLLDSLNENEQNGGGEQTVCLLKELKNIFFNSDDIDLLNGYSSFGIDYFKMKIAKERITKNIKNNNRAIN